MGSALVIIILVVIVIAAVMSSRKHFGGQGGCCGGDSGATIAEDDIPVKELTGEKIGEKTVSISGMSCLNCVFRVTRAINRIDGASASVDLDKGQAVVSYDREIPDDVIRKAVENIGYKVTDIK